jgi:phage terminase large subunit GpA-like protein
MDAFSNDDIEVIVVKKSARVGYTKMLVALIAYVAPQAPQPGGMAANRRRLG